MATYTFFEIVNHARKNSVFFAEFYKNVSENETNIAKYPIMIQEKFWEANSLENNKVLTQKTFDGILFKSGGTTGNPKFSYFTNEEWAEFTKSSAKGYQQNGIKAGDRVANLFYAGELYASFLYITFTSFFANKGIIYPISGGTKIEEIVHIISTLKINVLAGVPTTIMKVAEYIAKHPDNNIKIDLVLFGGESFYADQRDVLKKIFPDVQIHSILYASVDGGELGYSDSSCSVDEHRTFSETTLLEIVNEDTGEIITEPHIKGKILITNLCRKLMPIIRYPAGDKAMWTEPEGTPNRKFKLLGRTEEGARIGPCTLYVEDAMKIIDNFSNELQVLNFQIVIEHFDNKDQASILIVPLNTLQNKNILAEKIKESIYKERHMLQDSVNHNIIHPIQVKFIENSELIVNQRTGKAKRIVDNRFKS